MSDVEKNIKSVIHGYSRQKEEEQTKLIAAENKLPYINLVNYPFTGDVLGIIPEDIAKKFSIVAFQRVGNTVRVATPYPFAVGLTEAMNSIGSTKSIIFEPHMASLTSIKYSLKQYKLVQTITKTEAVAKQESIDEFMKQVRSLRDLGDVISRVNTTQLFEMVLSGALAFEASDIHFEPQSQNVRLRFRVDGKLMDITELTNESYHLLISRVKNLSGLKLNRLDKSQDGRFSITVASETVDVRVNILPSSFGETIVLRLLTGKGFLTLDELGLNEETIRAITRNIERQMGLVILTGPTGSGKTTTLYAVLKLLNQPPTKIITIEDPVEYKISGIEQIQVNPEQGFDFAQALRAVLRQDPDVILVGEVRDKETAEIAINAALTGHLVLTTLHTNSAPGSFARLIEVGVPTYLLADAISLIVAQRLIRRICEKCGGKGCEVCNMTGKKGRVAVSEFLEPDRDFVELVKNKATLGDFTKLYRSKGYRTLHDDLMEKIKSGIISKDEESAVD